MQHSEVREINITWFSAHFDNLQFNVATITGFPNKPISLANTFRHEVTALLLG